MQHNQKIFRDFPTIKILDFFVIILFMTIAFLSILFSLELINVYSIIHFFNLNNIQAAQPLFHKISTDQVMLSLWIIFFILFPTWFFIHKKRLQNSFINIIDILKNSENHETLLGYMVSDNWSYILWSGEIFEQIFKLSQANKKDKIKFLSILAKNKDMQVDKESILYITEQIRLKQSGIIEFKIRLGSQNSAFRISFTKIDTFYIWKVMLVNQEYTVLNSSFSRDILSNLPLPLFIVDSRGDLVYTNNCFNEIFHTKNLLKNSKLDVADFILEKKRAVNYSSKQINTEVVKIDKCIYKDYFGDKFEGLLFQSNLYKSSSTGLRYIRNIIIPDMDTFTRKQTKVIDSQYEDCLDYIYNQAPFGIIITDSEYKVLSTNSHIEDLFSGKGLAGSILTDIFNFTTDKIGINNDDKPKDLEVEVNINGTQRVLKIVVCNISEANKIIYVIDITHNRDLENQVQLSQGLQTIGQIASVVAHDFNNLLTAIMSFTYFLQEKNDNDNPSMVELDQIQQNANRAKIMIKQLLTFSRKQNLKPMIFNVNSEISDLMSTIVRLIGDNIFSEFFRDLNAGNIMMDRVQFQQVITNLVVNAKDAMRKGGKLHIYTKSVVLNYPKETVLGTIPEGSYVVVEVQDQGEGISKENMHLIFQSHFSTKGEKGNGLGLSTISKIMRDNAGFIDVKSILGTGSTFILYFPQDNDKNIHISKQVEKQPNIEDLTGHETVLLVEDEVPVRMVCYRLLKSKGYNVIEAENGIKALEILEKENIKNLDLIISDVVMPNMSGPDVVNRVRDLFPKVKAILMSGYAEDVLGDISLEGVDFLEKPFTPDVFASKVKSVVSRK